VHLDGKAVKSCTTLAVMAKARVKTIEALPRWRERCPMQEAFPRSITPAMRFCRRHDHDRVNRHRKGHASSLSTPFAKSSRAISGAARLSEHCFIG